MSDSTGDKPREARIGHEGSYNIGWNDAAKATIDQESMKADADYRHGVEAFKASKGQAAKIEPLGIA
jgi:hypothetical protein